MDERRITVNEMKFMRHMVGYAQRNHKHNEDFMAELKLETKLNYI